MRLLRSLFDWGGIRNKFLITSLLIGIVPLIALASVSYLVSSRATIGRSSEIIASNLQIASAMVDAKAQYVERIARRVLINQPIRDALKTAGGGDGASSTRTSQRIAEQLKQILIGSGDIASVSLFNWNGFRCRYRGTGGISALSAELGQFEGEEWYERTMQADGYECYFLYDVLSGDVQEGASSSYSVSMTKLLRDLDSGEPYGILIINANKSYYNSVLPSAIHEDEACYLMADRRGSRANYLNISPGAEEKMRGAIAEYLAGGDVDDCLVTSLQNQRTGWSVLHIVERAAFLSGSAAIFGVTLVALLMLIALSAGMSVVAARTITRPLTRLGRAIEEAGQGGIPGGAFGDDEVGRIGTKFVELVRRNENLNEELVQMSLLEKQAELDALQAQINPHFLYNTLSSIYWLSKFGRSDEAAEMAVTLSDIFKLALNKGRNMITVAQEIQHIERYLRIQNMRYNDRIHVAWDVDPSLHGEEILKLILQPLVENAIYHGLEPKTGGDWRLGISGRRDARDMVFVIEDNGVGMDAEHAVSTGYGIRNVSERIRLKYGKGYGCHFESGLGEGTRVTIRVPREGA